MISRRIGHHDKFRPDPKGYLCKIEGDNRVKFTSINILNLIDDDPLFLMNYYFLCNGMIYRLTIMLNEWIIGKDNP